MFIHRHLSWRRIGIGITASQSFLPLTTFFNGLTKPHMRPYSRPHVERYVAQTGPTVPELIFF
jgi:hypothetical protein